jgi:hypothetical protein
MAGKNVNTFVNKSAIVHARRGHVAFTDAVDAGTPVFRVLLRFSLS